MSPRDPRRLAGRGTSAGRLLSDAAALEPAPGAADRVWRGLLDAHAPLHASPAESDELRRLLSGAIAAVEPPAGARARLLRRLEEEAAARAGLAEPSRLADDVGALGTLVGAAAAIEPPFGHAARLGRRLRAPPFGWPRFALAGLAGAAAAALFALWPAPLPDARPVARRATAAPAPVAAVRDATPIPPAEQLRVAAGERYSHVLPEIGHLVLGGTETRVQLRREGAAGVRLELAEGRLVLHADKRRPDAPLVVVTADAEVRVVGTVFAVEALPGGTRVLVAEGTVDVIRRGAPARRVRAGGSDGSVGVRGSDSDAWFSRALVEAAGPALALRLPASLSPAPESTPPALAAAALPPTPVALPAAPVPAPASALDGLSPAELALTARQARFQGRPQLAAEALRRLAYSNVAPREQRLDAIWTLVTVLDEELGDATGALEVRREIARTSRLQRPEARWQILLSLSELGRGAEALEAAEACLRDCTEENRTAARFLRARLFQQLGRLDEARAAFQEARAATGVRGAERAAEALYFRARHLQLIGLADRSNEAAQLSLALAPDGVHAPAARALAER